MSKNYQPTDSELEILQFLWTNGPSSVRTINESLNLSRPVGYTSTLKIMQIMIDKKLLKRNTDNRTHIYEANIKEKEVKRNVVKDIIKQVFQGSTSKLVLQALGSQNTSQEEINEIKKFISELENQRNHEND